MKISVIVPVFNCADYVERCVRSIMAQTHTNLEIICVDDGSTDDSGKILDTLACEDARIQVVHKVNGGASSARNAGIDLATGDYITFVDSDDAVEEDMYETLLPYFDDEKVDIVHCGYKRVHLDGSIKEVNGTQKLVYQNNYEAAECLLAGSLFVGSLWNKMFRAELFSSIRMDRHLVINEDVLMLAELFRIANTIVYLDVGKYVFFERESSVTSITKQLKKNVDCLVAAERMLELYTNSPAERAAEERVLNCRIGLYRWYVMNAYVDSHQERKNLSSTINSILSKRKDIAFRQRVNYTIMRCLPVVYKAAYKIYDKIRVPNWDVKEPE